MRMEIKSIMKGRMGKCERCWTVKEVFRKLYVDGIWQMSHWLCKDCLATIEEGNSDNVDEEPPQRIL